MTGGSMTNLNNSDSGGQKDLASISFNFNHKPLFFRLCGYPLDDGTATEGNDLHFFSERVQVLNFALSIGIKNTSSDEINNLDPSIEKYWEAGTYNNELVKQGSSYEYMQTLVEGLYPNHNHGGINRLISVLIDRGFEIMSEKAKSGMFTLKSVSE
jgi:hypothetical protein